MGNQSSSRKSRESESKLIEASRRGNKGTVEALLKEGVDVNKASDDGSTPLIFASAWNRSNIIEILVKNGADVNARGNRGWTALHTAVDLNHKDAVITLLENGAVQNLINKDGKSALDLAQEKEIIDILKEKANEEAKTMASLKESESDLIDFSWNIYKDTVPDLLKERVDVNVKDEYGRTHLCLASFHGHLAAVQVLLENGANVNEPDEDGDTPLLASCILGKSAVVEELIKGGADVNIKNALGRTPLWLASNYGHLAAVNILLENTENINEPDEDGVTPLTFHCGWGQSDVVVGLIRRGADVNKANIVGITPLIAASERNHSNIIIILIQNGADVNAKNILGWTALHRAAKLSNKDAVVTLLEKGADPNMTNKQGKTALDLAKKPEIIEILKEKAASSRLSREVSHEGQEENDLRQLEVLVKERERRDKEIIRLREERDELILAKRQGADRDTPERVLSGLERRLAELVKEIPPRLVRNEYNFNTSNTNYGEKAGYQFFNIGQSPLAEELKSEVGERFVHLTIRIAQLESELLTKEREIEEMITRNEKVETNDEVELRAESSKAGSCLAEETETGLREKIEWLTETISRLQKELGTTKRDMDRLEEEKDSQIEELRAENAAHLKELVELRERVCGLLTTKVEQRTEIIELEKRVKELQRASSRVSTLVHSPDLYTCLNPR